MTVPASGSNRFRAVDQGPAPPLEGRPLASRRTWLIPVATAAVGALVTLVLTLLTQHDYVRNQQRLLGLRVRDAGSLLLEAVPATETPLAQAAALAVATDGNAPRFEAFVRPSVGVSPSDPFVSISLWRVGALGAGPLAVVGTPPHIDGAGAGAAFLDGAARHAAVTIIGMLRGPHPRLGYALGATGRSGGYVVYAEKLVPADRRSRFEATTAFAGLGYAIYLGHAASAGNLIVTNSPHPPLRGTTASVTVPYGDGALTLVMSSRSSLAGWLPAALPWIIAVVGGLLTLMATLAVSRISLRRRDAERLAGTFQRRAGESRRLYAEQRTIAQTLQHALLPTLPDIPGLLASARYDAGELGIDIGGDWYDLIDRGQGRVLMVVGDVSGRGLRAATTMASLRYAIHAYAALGDPAATIMTRLGRLVSVIETGELATVLLAEIDVVSHRISVTSAGHPPPLLLSAEGGEFVPTPAGPPVGTDRAATYATITISAPAGATLVAYTDGLVERRGESLDVGLERLRELACRERLALTDLLGTLVSELTTDPTHDDIAILGVRWTT